MGPDQLEKPHRRGCCSSQRDKGVAVIGISQ
jgi:hypothetical protein